MHDCPLISEGCADHIRPGACLDEGRRHRQRLSSWSSGDLRRLGTGFPSDTVTRRRRGWRAAREREQVLLLAGIGVGVLSAEWFGEVIERPFTQMSAEYI